MYKISKNIEEEYKVKEVKIKMESEGNMQHSANVERTIRQEIYIRKEENMKNLTKQNLTSENKIRQVNSLEVMRLHQQFGNKWTMIAKLLEVNDEMIVKNCFYSFVRRVIRKIKKNTIVLHEKEDHSAYEQINYILEFMKPFLYDKDEQCVTTTDKGINKFKIPHQVYKSTKKEKYISRIIKDSQLTLYDILRFEVTLAKWKVTGRVDDLLGSKHKSLVSDGGQNEGITEETLTPTTPDTNLREMFNMIEGAEIQKMGVCVKIEAPDEEGVHPLLPSEGGKELGGRYLDNSLGVEERRGEAAFSPKWEREERYKYSKERTDPICITAPYLPNTIPLPQIKNIRDYRGECIYQHSLQTYPFGICPQAAQIIKNMSTMRNYGTYVYPPIPFYGTPNTPNIP